MWEHLSTKFLMISDSSFTMYHTMWLYRCLCGPQQDLIAVCADVGCQAFVWVWWRFWHQCWSDFAWWGTWHQDEATKAVRFVSLALKFLCSTQSVVSHQESKPGLTWKKDLPSRVNNAFNTVPLTSHLPRRIVVPDVSWDKGYSCRVYLFARCAPSIGIAVHE